MTKSKLEKILDSCEGVSSSKTETVAKLKEYLDTGGEELTLDQYKQVRKAIQKYETLLKRDQNGHIQNQVDYVNRVLTDYLRNTHYRLLDEERGVSIEQVPVKEKPLKWYERVKQKVVDWKYKRDWKKSDTSMYDLERKAYGFNDTKTTKSEKELIDDVPTKGLSWFKKNTLNRIKDRVQYQSRLEDKVNMK